MRPEELVFILANSARRGIREPSVVDSIPKLGESDLPPQPFSIPAGRTLDEVPEQLACPRFNCNTNQTSSAFFVDVDSTRVGCLYRTTTWVCLRALFEPASQRSSRSGKL